MQRFTRLISIAIILLILNSLVACIASICLLITDFENTFFISILGIIVYGLLVTSLAFGGSCAFDAAKECSAHFKLKMALNCCGNSNGEEYQNISSKLLVLDQLEENIQMCPLGLFALGRSYILTFCGIMFSYSVILIQTSNTDFSKT